MDCCLNLEQNKLIKKQWSKGVCYFYADLGLCACGFLNFGAFNILCAVSFGKDIMYYVKGSHECVSRLNILHFHISAA